MLVTLTEAKEHLQIPIDDTKFDTLLTSKINTVSSLAEHYCNRIFVKTVITEILRPKHIKHMYVVFTRQIPINEIISIKYLDGDKLELSDLEIDMEIGKISNLVKDAEIQYNAGLFDANNIPADLKEFCFRKLAELFMFRTSGSNSEEYNNVKLVRSVGLNDDDKMFLDYYRLMNV